MSLLREVARRLGMAARPEALELPTAESRFAYLKDIVAQSAMPQEVSVASPAGRLVLACEDGALTAATIIPVAGEAETLAPGKGAATEDAAGRIGTMLSRFVEAGPLSERAFRPVPEREDAPEALPADALDYAPRAMPEPVAPAQSQEEETPDVAASDLAFVERFAGVMEALATASQDLSEPGRETVAPARGVPLVEGASHSALAAFQSRLAPGLGRETVVLMLGPEAGDPCVGIALSGGSRRAVSFPKASLAKVCRAGAAQWKS